MLPQPSNTFQGDFSSLWQLGTRQPLRHLTWDWWWWLIMLDDEQHSCGKQLMVLWSTKDNDQVEVNGLPWKPQGRPGKDEHGGMLLDGMVCAWWFDGQRMIEPYIKRTCKMVALGDDHPSWPGPKGEGTGGGAVVPLLEDDFSMGLSSDHSSFWLRIQGDDDAVEKGAPSTVSLSFTPWNPAMSVARPSSATYAGEMGYDILRVHGTKVSGRIDQQEVTGTAYFQKVCVQAPSPPWYWGVLHFEDGSYLDWFLPHVAFTMTSRDARPWKKRDSHHAALSQGGLFHDAKNKRTERFARVEVEKYTSTLQEGTEGQCPNAPLPCFRIKMWNGRTSVKIEVQAMQRAHWHFDQPTTAGLWSHLTYNEYPLTVNRLEIDDEFGQRRRHDFGWIRGNAEHAWGLLH